jgi:hypothetical protein
MARSQEITAAGAESMSAQLAQGFRWGRCGWDEVRRDMPLWIGMSGLYLLPAVLIHRLPFAGTLLLLLLSPMLLAGVLLALDRSKASPAATTTSTDRWVARPGRALFTAFTDEKRVYSAILLGMLTLGLFVLVFIIEDLFGLGSFRALLSAPSHQVTPLWSIALGLLGATVLHTLLAMSLLYAAHRTILAERDPVAGIGDSFSACARYPYAFAVLVGLFLLPYLLIVTAFSVSPVLGYLLLFTLGLAALPAFVAATVCSYREVFAAPAKS